MAVATAKKRTDMARKKGALGRPREGRDKVTTKIDRKLRTMINFVASRRGMHAAELLDELLRVPLTRIYVEISREIESEMLGGSEEKKA